MSTQNYIEKKSCHCCCLCTAACPVGKTSANIGKLALFSVSSDPSNVTNLQSDKYIQYSLLRRNFTKIHAYLSMRRSIYKYIDGQLEKAVVASTNGKEL